MAWERQGEADVPEGAALPVDDESLASPNCTSCLTPMAAEQAASGSPFWRCAACGAARLS